MLRVPDSSVAALPLPRSSSEALAHYHHVPLPTWMCEPKTASAKYFAVGVVARVLLLGGLEESGVPSSLVPSLAAALHSTGGLWVLAKAVSTR